MAGVNKVIIIGNLGRDPEIKYTQSNVPVANFSVATTESWKDKTSGEWQEKTEWHRVVAWRHLAERAETLPDQGQAGLHRGPARDPQVDRAGRPGPLHHRDRRESADAARAPG